MHIKDIRITSSDASQELSACCGDLRVWYQLPPPFTAPLSADPFLIACLLPAMAAGEDIVIDDTFPVSPALLKNLALVQKNFCLWSDYFFKTRRQTFKAISIHAPNQQATQTAQGSAAFFSGGIDGLYTFLKQPENIDHLMFVDGIDMQLENPLATEAVDSIQRFLDRYDKKVSLLRSNVRFLAHAHGLSWMHFTSGAGLASIAVAAGVQDCYLASSNANDDFVPDGSNAITDPLWSNGDTRIYYDGAERTRAEKIAYVFAAAPEAGKLLRVCWQDQGYNCGECEKCMRTMLTLDLLGLKAERFPAFEPRHLQKLSKVRLYIDDDVVFFKENLRLALNNGRPDVARALMRPIRAYRFRKLLKDALALVRSEV